MENRVYFSYAYDPAATCCPVTHVHGSIRPVIGELRLRLFSPIESSSSAASNLPAAITYLYAIFREQGTRLKLLSSNGVGHSWPASRSGL